jgi:hypothetical protein
MKVNSGEVTQSAALRTIRRARRRFEKVKQLLRSLGNKDESTAVSVRFRRLAKDLASEPANPASAAVYSDLTLAMHDLNHCLASHFYPGG